MKTELFTTMAIGKCHWEMNSRFSFEECDFVYLVIFEGGCVLRSPAKSNFVLEQVLFHTDEIVKGSNRWKYSGVALLERCRLELEQYLSICLYANSSHIVTRMSYFTNHSDLPVISIHTKFSPLKKFTYSK